MNYYKKLVNQSDDFIVKRLVDYQNQKIHNDKKKDKLVTVIKTLFSDFEIFENFVDEFYNFFHIVIKSDKTKIGVIFISELTLENKLAYSRFQNKLAILSNSFEWSFVVVNQSSDYEINNVVQLIDQKINCKSDKEN